MPELPDIIVYIEALDAYIRGRQLRTIALKSAFVLRSVTPPLTTLEGRTVQAVHRIGKRIALEFNDELFLVIHLMIAGRLRWRGIPPERKIADRIVLARCEFDHGTLFFTEAGSKKRASLQVIDGRAALAAIDPGGVEPLDASLTEFRAALIRDNHTLKRALTDPHLFSGIGNAYSDEILHAAMLSPLKLSRALSDDESLRLFEATQRTLLAWIARLRVDRAGGFPEKVTAFHDEMAVHGRFRQSCPRCAGTIQRIVYAENECNYCPQCQTGGRVLADRALSRLLK